MSMQRDNKKKKSSLKSVVLVVLLAAKGRDHVKDAVDTKECRAPAKSRKRLGEGKDVKRRASAGAVDAREHLFLQSTRLKSIHNVPFHTQQPAMGMHPHAKTRAKKMAGKQQAGRERGADGAHRGARRTILRP